LGIHARILAVASAIGSLTAALGAEAEPLDPTLSRFVVNTDPVQDCQRPAGGVYGQYNPSYLRPGGDPTQALGVCIPDHDQFTRLISEWAFIVAPNAMHTARTTGYGGFHFSLQGAYTKIDNESQYWMKGAQGDRDPSTGGASDTAHPPPLVSHYSIVARKSFGFGVETALNLGFVPSSSLITGGADLRMSILEGFRTGILGVLPDVAAGGSVRTVTGTTEFQLTVAGVDVQLSKPLTIASSSVLTPWIGYQHLWIFGNSGLIDLTPATDPLGMCGFLGPDIPGTPEGPPAPGAAGIDNGQPVCSDGGSPLDFNNNVVFDEVRLKRHRLMFGLNYRYELVSVGGQFITDLMAPSEAQTSTKAKTALRGSPRQWTMVVELGVHF